MFEWLRKLLETELKWEGVTKGGGRVVYTVRAWRYSWSERLAEHEKVRKMFSEYGWDMVYHPRLHLDLE